MVVCNGYNFSVYFVKRKYMGALKWVLILLLSGCVSTDYADKKAYDKIEVEGHIYIFVKSPDFDGLAIAHSGGCRGKHY